MLWWSFSSSFIRERVRNHISASSPDHHSCLPKGHYWQCLEPVFQSNLYLKKTPKTDLNTLLCSSYWPEKSAYSPSLGASSHGQNVTLLPRTKARNGKSRGPGGSASALNEKLWVIPPLEFMMQTWRDTQHIWDWRCMSTATLLPSYR